MGNKNDKLVKKDKYLCIPFPASFRFAAQFGIELNSVGRYAMHFLRGGTFLKMR